MIRFLLILAFLSPFVSLEAPALNPSQHNPVLLELFTSEGVFELSSCRPSAGRTGPHATSSWRRTDCFERARGLLEPAWLEGSVLIRAV